MSKINPEEKLNENNSIYMKIQDYKSNSSKKQTEEHLTDNNYLRRKRNLNTKEKQNLNKITVTKISNFSKFKNDNSNINNITNNTKSFYTNKTEKNNKLNDKSNYFGNDSDKNYIAENDLIISAAEANKENEMHFINHPDIIYKSKKNEILTSSENQKLKSNESISNKSRFNQGITFRKSAEDVIGDFISRNNKIENYFKFYKTDKNVRFDSLNEISAKRRNTNFENFANSKIKNDFFANNENENHYEIINNNTNKTNTINTQSNFSKRNFINENKNDYYNNYTKTPNDLGPNENFDYEILDWNNPESKAAGAVVIADAAKNNFFSKSKFDKIEKNSINNNDQIKDEEFIYNKPLNKNLSYSTECFKNADLRNKDFLFSNINNANENNKYNFSSSFNIKHSNNFINKNNSNDYEYIENKLYSLNRIKKKNSNKNLNAKNKTEEKIGDIKNNINNFNDINIEVNFKSSIAKAKMMNNEDSLPSEKKELRTEKSIDYSIKTIRNSKILNTEYEKINTEIALTCENYGTLEQNEAANDVIFKDPNMRSGSTLAEKQKSNSEKNLKKSNNNNNQEQNANNKLILVEDDNKNNKQFFSQSNKSFAGKRHDSLIREKTNLEFITNALNQQKRPSKANNTNSSFKNQIQNNNKIFESQNAVLSLQNLNQKNDIKENNEEKTITCRICLENNIIQTNTEPEEPFISPCVCHGTMKYVHESCLKKWIPKQVKKTSKAECEICKSKYKIKFQTKLVYSSEKMCTFLEKFFTFLGIVCLMLFIVCFVIYSIVVNIVKFTADEKDTFTLILSLSGVAIILIVVAIILKSYKNHVYEVVPTNWTILEVDSKDENYEKNITFEIFRKLSEELDASARLNTQANIVNSSFNVNINDHVIINDVPNANANNVHENINNGSHIHYNGDDVNFNRTDLHVEENNININELDNFRQEIDIDFRNANLIRNNNNNVQIIHFPYEPNLIVNNNQQNDVIKENTEFNLNRFGSGAYDNSNNLIKKENENKEFKGASQYFDKDKENNQDLYNYQDTQFHESIRNSNHFNNNNLKL